MIEKCRSLLGLVLQSQVEEYPYSLPTFLIHGNSILAVSLY
jgi:hypothetical protein